MKILKHCMKSVQIRSFSGPYFPVFELSADQKNSVLNPNLICITSDTDSGIKFEVSLNDELCTNNTCTNKICFKVRLVQVGLFYICMIITHSLFQRLLEGKRGNWSTNREHLIWNFVLNQTLCFKRNFFKSSCHIYWDRFQFFTFFSRKVNF